MEELLKKLISIDSVSGNENAIQKFIAKYIKRTNLKPLVVEGNVVVHIKGKNPSKAIIFNSHVDTVGAGDKKMWHKDPFQAYRLNGKIYGLGASDEKASIVVLLLLSEFLSQNQPDCDVWIAFVCQEEVDGRGSRKFMEWFSSKYSNNYKNLAGVIAEPTNLKKIEVGHRGNIFIEITTFGKSGHGSKPIKDEEHAILMMYKIIDQLKSWFDNEKIKYIDNILGTPSLGVATSIEAGNKKVPNKFPDKCTISCDIRTTPQFHQKAIDILVDRLKHYDSTVKVDVIGKPSPYGYTDINENIVRVFKSLTDCELTVSDSSNDLCFFSERNIPAVVFGPGNHDCIHKANENCELNNIKKCVEVYKNVIRKFAKIT